MTIVSAILVLILASSTARFLEERYNPVYENVETVVIDGSGSSTSVLFRGVRTRDCDIVRVKARVDGAHVTADILVQERGDLPILLSSSFRFVLVIRVPAGRLEELKVISSCHPFWVTQQDLLKNE
jgi:hypothetical protein